jgi:hypothetical protein
MRGGERGGGIMNTTHNSTISRKKAAWKVGPEVAMKMH